jgi:hypothetical protein
LRPDIAAEPERGLDETCAKVMNISLNVENFPNFATLFPFKHARKAGTADWGHYAPPLMTACCQQP